MLTDKPGFSKDEGYDVILSLLNNGTQALYFSGPMFYKPLIFNSSTVASLLAVAANSPLRASSSRFIFR